MTLTPEQEALALRHYLSRLESIPADELGKNVFVQFARAGDVEHLIHMLRADLPLNKYVREFLARILEGRELIRRARGPRAPLNQAQKGIIVLHWYSFKRNRSRTRSEVKAWLLSTADKFGVSAKAIESVIYARKKSPKKKPKLR